MGNRFGDYVIERALETTNGVAAYHATHARLPRRIVLAIAPSARAGELLAHARALETLRHPGVPRVYECGVNDAGAWLAIERLDGAALAPRTLAAAIAIALVRDVAAILEHAHARAVVHAAIGADAIVVHAGAARVVRWADARIASDADARARADDIAALGAVVRTALAEPRAAPVLAALIEDMTQRDRDARPSAAAVRARAEQLAARAADDDDPPIEEVALVDISYALDRPRPSRWTPALGVASEDFACRTVAGDAQSPRHDRRPERYRSR